MTQTSSTSRFTFHYVRGRPEITAQLRFQANVKYCNFLVDTGADFTLISKSLAMQLGIDFEELKKNPTNVELANHKRSKVFKTYLALIISNTEIYIPVLVADDVIDNLLGRKGVFDYFDVLFQDSKQSLTFIPP